MWPPEERLPFAVFSPGKACTPRCRSLFTVMEHVPEGVPHRPEQAMVEIPAAGAAMRLRPKPTAAMEGAPEADTVMVHLQERLFAHGKRANSGDRGRVVGCGTRDRWHKIRSESGYRASSLASLFLCDRTARERASHRLAFD